jgi:hypothetical protein
MSGRAFSQFSTGLFQNVRDNTYDDNNINLYTTFKVYRCYHIVHLHDNHQ